MRITPFRGLYATETALGNTRSYFTLGGSRGFLGNTVCENSGFTVLESEKKL